MGCGRLGPRCHFGTDRHGLIVFNMSNHVKCRNEAFSVKLLLLIQAVLGSLDEVFPPGPNI
jgi:hypothetical protein